MTTQQLHLFNAVYLVVFVVVALFTRATARRIVGALAGGAVAGVAALGIIALGEEVGWWRFAIHWEPYFLTLLWIDFALGAFIFLITWRIARRFGWAGWPWSWSPRRSSRPPGTTGTWQNSPDAAPTNQGSPRSSRSPRPTHSSSILC